MMNDLRTKIMEIAKRRGIFWKAYEIYGGLAGFYDYGPVGSALKNNILNLWREIFVISDSLIEIDSPNLGPEIMYIASGHADKFTDYMVKCQKCGHAFRADELLKDHIPDAEGLDADRLWKELQAHQIKCPDCGGDLTYPERFHLMFPTTVGLGKKAFLRPETAQGIFVNFPILYRLNREKLPLGVAQVGKGFRNEISPRQGLLRLREFNMAEIELFIDPEENFELDSFGEVKIPIKTRDGSESVLTAEEIAKRGIARPEIAYYMAKTLKFLKTLGIPENKIRFRQHHHNELAHYSQDTWDCEINLSLGWTEVIGISYRGDYDLKRHMDFSARDMTAIRRFKEPKKIKVKKVRPRMEILGPMFKSKAKKVAELLEKKEPSPAGIEVELDRKRMLITPEAYDIVDEEITVGGERFIPHVIEPSFGIDRILYAVLEFAYYERPKTGYKVLRFPPKIAPIKAAVFPLMTKDGLDGIARDIKVKICGNGIPCYYDDSGSIGRRYARADEIGVPFCITVDYQTREDNTVTLRERDSAQQKRIPISALTSVLKSLVEGTKSFDDL